MSIAGDRLRPRNEIDSGNVRRSQSACFLIALSRYHDYVRQCGNLLDNSSYNLAPVVRLAAVLICVHCNKYSGLNLAKSVKNCVLTKLRSAYGPNGADACDCKKADNCLRDIRQVCDDTVARPNSHLL